MYEEMTMKTADGVEVVIGMTVWNDSGDEFVVFEEDLGRMLSYGSKRFYADFGKLCEYRIAQARTTCEAVVEHWNQRRVEHEQRTVNST
jgi:hypothetical protein